METKKIGRFNVDGYTVDLFDDGTSAFYIEDKRRINVKRNSKGMYSCIDD